MKLFEIGLGCNFNASSVELWKSLLNDRDELWMGEINEKCIKDYKDRGRLEGMNVLEGDQTEPGSIQHWAQLIGPNIDIIIDDGCHQNNAISNTFFGMWDSLVPGGLYFIEDMVDLSRSYKDKFGNFFLNYLDSWNRQLSLWASFDGLEALAPPFLLPSRLKWIFCQAEACVFAKCDSEETSNCAKSRKQENRKR